MGGQDKLLQLVDGVPLLRLQAQNALDAGEQVIVCLPPPPHPRTQILNDLPVDFVVVDADPPAMSASLQAGIRALPASASGVLVHLADMPELTRTDLAALLAAREKHPDALVWRGATAEGTPGHPVLFDASLFPQFDDLSGDEGARPVIRAAAGSVATVDLPAMHAITDLDTPEAWAAWRARTGR